MNQLIHDLTKRFQIDEIYQWTYHRNGKKYQMLQIHIQPRGRTQMVESRKVIGRIVAEYADVHFSLYYTKEVQRMVDQGLGRFFLICQPENRVFQREDLEEGIRLPKFSPAEIANKTMTYIEAERQKSQAFLEGYHFYLERKNYTQASFMLHQALELTFRVILVMLTGDEKHTHCHFEIIAHLKVFDSKFTWLNKKDMYRESLRKLNEAYSSSRYDQGFQVGKGQLDVVFQLYEEILTWLDEYQVDVIQEIKQQLSPTYLAQKKIERLKENYVSALEDRKDISHRELIVNALQVFCEPQSVRCFAYRNKQQQCSNLLLVADEKDVMHHYFLFIGVLENSIHTLQLQGMVNQLLPDYLTVTLIVETQENILRHVQQGQLFFCNVLRTGEVWLEEKGCSELDTISIPVPQRSITYLKKQWERKLRDAKILYEIEYSCDYDGDERVLCCASALATERICTGIIRVYLGYYPSVLNLNYLMQFLDLLCPEVTTIFGLHDTKGKERFRLLNNALQDFRYTANYNVCEDKVLVLHEMVSKFIDKSEEFVTKHFEALSQPVLTD